MSVIVDMRPTMPRDNINGMPTNTLLRHRSGRSQHTHLMEMSILVATAAKVPANRQRQLLTDRKQAEKL